MAAHRRLGRVAAHVAPPSPARQPAATAAELEPDALTEAEVEFFFDQGYLICENLVSADHASAIMQDMDDLVAELGASRGFRTDTGTALASSGEIARTPTLGALPGFPPVVERVRCLMAANAAAAEDGRGGTELFSFHHQHGSRMDAGTDERAW